MARTALAALLCLVASAAQGHSGDLDAKGCHNDLDAGKYHCHAAADEVPVVKKSRSGICHDQTSQYYDRTIHFQAFDSLEKCLQSGGRLPKA